VNESHTPEEGRTYFNRHVSTKHADDLDFIIYSTMAIALVVLVGLAMALLLTPWSPTITQLKAIGSTTVILLMLPLLTVVFLKVRHVFWSDRHVRKSINWSISRMHQDIAGAYTDLVYERDNSWFVDACSYWFQHGESSTTYNASHKVLGLSLIQWRAARDELINAGIAKPVKRQGGGEGFRIVIKDWNTVLKKMPSTPNVTQLNAYTSGNSYKPRW
jgi:hypothetical protein